MVSTMTASSATRKLELARALAPTIRASAERTEARHELLSQLFEAIPTPASCTWWPWPEASAARSCLDRPRGLVWANLGFRDGQRARLHSNSRGEAL